MKFLGQTNTIFCINIVINYTDISGCPKKFVAVTTLHESEFTEILSYFSERWRIHQSRYTLSNTWRVNKPRKDETLKLVEDKPSVGRYFLFSIISKITQYRKLWA